MPLYTQKAQQGLGINPKVLRISPLEREHALQMLTWSYEHPYEMYDLSRDASEKAVSNLLRPELNYFAVLDERDEMIAYRCFGSDAQVAGGDYSERALDLGGGLRPDKTGRGLGRHILGAAMLFGLQKFHPAWFRVTVASFNIRAKKVCERLGFVRSTSFNRLKDGVAFDVLVARAAVPELTIPLEQRPNQAPAK